MCRRLFLLSLVVDINFPRHNRRYTRATSFWNEYACSVERNRTEERILFIVDRWSFGAGGWSSSRKLTELMDFKLLLASRRRKVAWSKSLVPRLLSKGNSKRHSRCSAKHALCPFIVLLYRLPLDSLETERKKWRFFHGFSTTNQKCDRRVISLRVPLYSHWLYSTLDLIPFPRSNYASFYLFIFLLPSPSLLFVSSNRFFPPPWLSLVFSFFLYAFSFLITIALFASALQINRQ